MDARMLPAPDLPAHTLRTLQQKKVSCLRFIVLFMEEYDVASTPKPEIMSQSQCADLRLMIQASLDIEEDLEDFARPEARERLCWMRAFVDVVLSALIQE